jgi:hypothetical protein
VLSQPIRAGTENLGKRTVSRRRRPISKRQPAVSDIKKERRRNSGRPSSMSLSEEGSFVSCIGARAGNRSTFFKRSYRRKGEQIPDTHPSRLLVWQMNAPISALGCHGLTAFPRLEGPLRWVLAEVEVNNFPAHQMHSVKLVRGTPGEIAHMPAHAFQSNYASPPKGRAIGEFLEQIVFMVHRSPFPATL